jgi:hypothetical protein
MAKGKKNALNDPSKVLKGRALARSARQLANIELNPTIGSYRRLGKRLRRDQQRDTRGLRELGRRTDSQLSGLYAGGDKIMAQGQADSRANAAELSGAIGNTASGVSEDQVALQSSVLGNQINSLANQMIQPGYSASQNALAQTASAQQGRQAQTGAAWSNLATMIGQGNIQESQNQRRSVAQRGLEDRGSARNMLASRMADTRSAYGEARRDAAGKLADTRALKGATRTKYLLELRAGERSFVNERAAIAASRQQNAIENDQNQQKIDNDSDGNQDGGYKLWDNPGKLQRPEWRQIKDAAATVIGNKNVTDWGIIADKIANVEGIDASASEMAKAIRKLKELYGKK